MTETELGEMVPPVPALVETVFELIVKLAETVQLPVMAPVVKVLPDKLPPQPLTELME